jgi:hypothetical protein
MTDAKEPEVIAQLLHSEECGRSLLYDVYGNELCSIAAILNHIDALTRERDEARKERDDIIMICRGTQIDDAALASMRKYVEEKLRIERERDAARKVTDAARALYRASAVDRVSVDDVQEKLSALFVALEQGDA